MSVRSLPTAVLTVSALVCVAETAAAQGSDAEWARVQQVRPGTVVRITMMGAEPVNRRVISIDVSSVSVRELPIRAKTVHVLPRTGIAEISAPKPRSMGKRVGHGLLGYVAVGFGAGLLGVAAFGQPGLVAVLPGGLIGGFVGARGGFRRPSEVIFSNNAGP
jgi:hypothetical protein